MIDYWRTEILGMVGMVIRVSKHAMKRYRERLFDYTSSTERIRSMLSEIVLRGKQVVAKPASTDDCFEVIFKGISIVLAQRPNECIVITCLGEPAYRKWIKNREQNVINGRLRHEPVAM